jgi:Domain of unknown function (DUF6933)
MVVLRPTRKLHTLLPPAAEAPCRSDTALGDWYCNRIVIDGRPLLLLVSSTSLLSLLEPAREIRTLARRLADLVDARLRRLGVIRLVRQAEGAAMSPVTIAPTADRAVLGIMVDFAKAVPFYLDQGTWDDAELRTAEARLAETPCFATDNARVLFPDKKASELLHGKWESGAR